MFYNTLHFRQLQGYWLIFVRFIDNFIKQQITLQIFEIRHFKVYRCKLLTQFQNSEINAGFCFVAKIISAHFYIFNPLTVDFCLQKRVNNSLQMWVKTLY